MTITPVAYPVAPSTVPLRATLLHVATASDSYAWLTGDDLFDSYNCMKFQHSAAFCAPNNKTFDQAAVWQSGARFAVYGGVTCKAIGLDQAHMLSEAERVFKTGESTAVEQGLMVQRFAADPDDRWEAPTDITPAGGAVKPGVGMALLEGHAASNYVGMPTLHMPVTIASLILGADGAAFDGDVLQTKLGSKIVAGAGYDYPNLGPDGEPAPAGEKWVYATGEVLVASGDFINRQVMSYSDNDVFVLAERGYIVAVDCYTAAVRVTVAA